EHVLIARREPIDARREDGLNGLGQRDLLDGGGRCARTALAAQEAAFDERADDLLDEEGIAAGASLDPGRERGKGWGGPEPEGEGDRIDRRRARQTAPNGPSDVCSRSAFVDAEESAPEFDDRVEGEHPPVGERAGAVERHAARALDELVTQAALSRPRLRGDQDDLRSTGLCVAQGPLEAGKLALAADEAREAARAWVLEAALDRTRPPPADHPHANARAPESVLSAFEK